MSALPLDEVRGVWAATARWPRWGWYLRADGPHRGPPSEYQRRLFRRGREYEAYVLEQLEARYGADSGDTRRLLSWPGGLAHPDAVIAPERLTVEVKSRLDIDALYEHEILQTAGYAAWCGRPATGLWRRSSDALRERVREAIRQVTSDATPDRTCESPEEGTRRGCPFTAHCFRDWERPDPTVLDEPRLCRLARDLLAAQTAYDRKRRAADATVEHLRVERDSIRAQLAEHLEPGREYRLGGLLVRREPFASRGSYEGNWTVRQVGELSPITAEDDDASVPF